MAQEGGGSRLDRLLRLLETGSTPAARNEAARQIGELASLHSNQLPNLLRRVSVEIFLFSLGTLIFNSLPLSFTHFVDDLSFLGGSWASFPPLSCAYKKTRFKRLLRATHGRLTP